MFVIHENIYTYINELTRSLHGCRCHALSSHADSAREGLSVSVSGSACVRARATDCKCVCFSHLYCACIAPNPASLKSGLAYKKERYISLKYTKVLMIVVYS